MANKTDDKELLQRALRIGDNIPGTPGPGPNPQPEQGPDPATLTAVEEELAKLGDRMGLPILTEEDQPEGGAAHSTDAELDAAYIRFLRRRPDIAARTMSAEGFLGLGDVVRALASVEEGATPLSLSLLQVVIRLDGGVKRFSDQVIDICRRPREQELAPGITVGQARILLARTIQSWERREQLSQERKQRGEREQRKADEKVADARQLLEQEQRVARLRSAVRKEGALPRLGRARSKDKTKTKKGDKP